MKITFRKGDEYSGMMRLPKTYDINSKGKNVGVIQEKEGELWFWYALCGPRVNTCHTPKTLLECKADAIEHFNSLTTPT